MKHRQPCHRQFDLFVPKTPSVPIAACRSGSRDRPENTMTIEDLLASLPKDQLHKRAQDELSTLPSDVIPAGLG